MKRIINLLVIVTACIAMFMVGYTCGEEKGREDVIEIVRPTMVKTIDELRVLKSQNDELKAQYDSLKAEAKEREDEDQEIEFIRHHAAWLDYVAMRYIDAYGDEILEDSMNKYNEIESINFVK